MSTIKDVAKMAQVFIGTVSNVLNGKTKNEELIERVSHAMDILNYSPDMNAQSLRNAKSGLIGIVLPAVYYGNVKMRDPESCQVLIDYKTAFGQMLSELKEAGKKKVVFILNPELEKNQELIELYTQQFGSQMMIVSTDNEDYAFQVFYQMAENYPDIDAVIAGSHVIAYGVEKVKRILLLHKLSIAVFKESSWIVDDGHYFGRITFGQEKVAKAIVKCLEEKIDENDRTVKQPVTVEVKCDIFHSEWDFGDA